ncbi:MAG: hypothetical protein B2I17_00395 [Thermoplasmatales archaeon B_DKE]|nr:MAG: hypothetical protein B2I17_00395 [Thermoplasmatales archaeon B_DKE]
MDSEKQFPTFDCMISNTQEPYDSEVENYFINAQYLAIELNNLRLLDREWSANYVKMIKFLSDLSDSIIYKKSPPSHDFLVDLAMGEETEDSSSERLLRSQNPLVGNLMRAALKARELMFWFVRLSKETRFAEGFNINSYEGLPFLRLVLVYRSIVLSK